MTTESLPVALVFELILPMNTMTAANVAKKPRSARMKIYRAKLIMSAMIVAGAVLIQRSPAVRDVRVRRAATMRKRSVLDFAIRWLLAWASLRLQWDSSLPSKTTISARRRLADVRVLMTNASVSEIATGGETR
jgi:hypothetical protein